MRNRLSASILSADFSRLESQIREIELAQVDWVHIDVMDGHFVPNITMGPFIVNTCHKLTSMPLDVHLMIEKPENHVEAFAQAGANILTVHIEGNPNIHRTIEVIHSIGCKAGVSLNPGTHPDALDSILPFVDLVLVMTVNPGFSGQTFIPQMINKVASIHKKISAFPNKPYLEVDGGINPQTLSMVKKAGADTFVAATAIFKHPQGISAGVDSLLSVGD